MEYIDTCPSYIIPPNKWMPWRRVKSDGAKVILDNFEYGYEFFMAVNRIYLGPTIPFDKKYGDYDDNELKIISTTVHELNHIVNVLNLNRVPSECIDEFGNVNKSATVEKMVAEINSFRSEC